MPYTYVIQSTLTRRFYIGSAVNLISRIADHNAGNTTSSYYLGNTLVAQSVNGTLSYLHQDSLSSTSLMTDGAGSQIGNTVKYLPFGEARATINVPTDKLFTGQRLDSTGLY
jgi:hypothetical protein